MSRVQNPNLGLLMLAITYLEELADEMVFLGGCATGLLITDPAAPPIRPTKDVDAIVQISSHLEYRGLSKRLRKKGFTEDSSEDAPICRWKRGGLLLDVMPTDPQIFGFGNAWYDKAIRDYIEITLDGGLELKMVSAPYFLITKLEAVEGRGNGDILSSHDMEDIVAVIDGRKELLNEVELSSVELKTELAIRFKHLLEREDLVYAVSGHLPPDTTSQARLDLVLKRMEQIRGLK